MFSFVFTFERGFMKNKVNDCFLHIRIDSKLKRDLDVFCIRNDISTSKFVRLLIKQYLLESGYEDI